ncbi:hypothetical protein [Maribellus sediminis]|uniref:hypothetical protein n=1 Tax=Maribellus sediminis TaxID=2696285 RepID=UPI0014310DBC|nr:hypothetical protein [Maribellus sediminis]
MKFILLLSPLVMIIYLIWCYLKIGMTTTVSQTYRKLDVPLKALFPLTYVIYASPIMLVTADRWFIAAGIMFMLVASNPVYWVKEGLGDNLHYIGSYGAILLGHAGLIIMDYHNNSIQGFGGIAVYVTLAFIVFAAGVTFNLAFFKKVKHETYWMEVFAAISIPLTLFFVFK